MPYGQSLAVLGKDFSDKPLTLWIAVAGCLLNGLAALGIGIGTLLVAKSALGVGTGVMLIGYGLFVWLGPWLALRGKPSSWGMMIATSLLHAAVAASLLSGTDPAQVFWASLALAVQLIIVVSCFLSATRRALGRADSS